MAVRQLSKDVFSVGAIDWDRQIFDELIPLPDGTSYNAYLLRGRVKTVLIDAVDPAKQKELFLNLNELDISSLDFVVANHAEQDHSGAIPAVLERYPMAEVITNPKCKGFLMDLLHIPEEKFIEVHDGEELDLGGMTLKFIYTPWVHWPETMSTYLQEEKILFSCDFFGSHRAASNLYVEDECKVLQDAKRYYAEIMMPFRQQIKKNLEKLSLLAIDKIAPSHGPVYDRPSLIIDAYRDWVSDSVNKKVVIAYVSMHGSTQRIVDVLTSNLIKKGMTVVPVNLSVSDVGQFAMELVDAGALVFASPYVLAGMHPAVVYAAYLTNALRPKAKVVASVFSYGWGGRGAEQLRNMLSSLRAEFFEPVLIRGNMLDKDAGLLGDIVDRMGGLLSHV